MLTRFLNAALASCCLFLSSIAIALPQSVEFERIGNSDAIPDNVITTMVEDASGFIWLGTPSGLLRYDGYRFRLFSYSPHQSNSLSGNFVRTLHADPKGRIWVGSEPGGLAVYIPKLDSFLRLDESQSRISRIDTSYRTTPKPQCENPARLFPTSGHSRVGSKRTTGARATCRSSAEE